MDSERFAVVGNPDSWYFRDLERAAIEMNIGLSPFTWSQVQASVKSTQESERGLRVGDFDCVLIRSMPLGSLEQIIFRMNALGQAAETTKMINSPRSLEIAIDKYLCLAKLQRAGLSVPPSRACQSAEMAMDAFEDFDREAVVKPIFGGEGRGIMHVTDVDLAWRTFRTLERSQSVIYLQKKIAHCGFDTRILFVGDRWYAIERHHESDWRCNLSRGGRAVEASPTERQLEMARLAKETCGADVCGVDILTSTDNVDYAIEVNAVPGWKGLGKCLNVDVGAEVLRFAKSVSSSVS